MRYHFNKDTGRTGQCTAKVKCRLGLSVDEHFDTRDEAKAAYEKTMSSQTLTSVSGKTSGRVFKKDSQTAQNSVLTAFDDDNEGLLQSFPIVNESADFEEIQQEIREYSRFVYTASLSSDVELQKDERDYVKTLVDGEIPDSVPTAFQSSMAGINFHQIAARKTGYYARITKTFAKNLSEKLKNDTNEQEPVILDPMAGKGYFVKAMREQGIKTIGSDDKSWSDNQTADEIEDMDALKSLNKYGKDITHVVFSWAPLDSDIDKKMYQKIRKDFPHITVINIGEDKGGCTGSESFWDLLDEDVRKGLVEEEYDNCGYKTTFGLHDFVMFVKPVDNAMEKVKQNKNDDVKRSDIFAFLND